MKFFKPCCVAITVWIISLSIITGMGFAGIPIFYSNGFGVDSAQNVYIGNNLGTIAVFQDEALINSFSSPTSRGYRFTVENDTIRLGTGTNSYIMSLDGTILRETPDPRGSTDRELQFKRICSTVDGRTYRLERFLGRTRITDVTDAQIVIYQMPLGTFAAKLLLYLSSLLGIPSLIFIVLSLQLRKLQ